MCIYDNLLLPFCGVVSSFLLNLSLPTNFFLFCSYLHSWGRGKRADSWLYHMLPVKLSAPEVLHTHTTTTAAAVSLTQSPTHSLSVCHPVSVFFHKSKRLAVSAVNESFTFCNFSEEAGKERRRLGKALVVRGNLFEVLCENQILRCLIRSSFTFETIKFLAFKRFLFPRNLNSPKKNLLAYLIWFANCLKEKRREKKN